MFITIESGGFDINFVRMISSRIPCCGEFEKVFIQFVDDKNQKQSYNTQLKINIFYSQIEKAIYDSKKGFPKPYNNSTFI